MGTHAAVGHHVNMGVNRLVDKEACHDQDHHSRGQTSDSFMFTPLHLLAK